MREPMIDAFTFKLYRTNLELYLENLDALTFKHSFHIYFGFLLEPTPLPTHPIPPFLQMKITSQFLSL